MTTTRVTAINLYDCGFPKDIFVDKNGWFSLEITQRNSKLAYTYSFMNIVNPWADVLQSQFIDPQGFPCVKLLQQKVNYILLLL